MLSVTRNRYRLAGCYSPDDTPLAIPQSPPPRQVGTRRVGVLGMSWHRCQWDRSIRKGCYGTQGLGSSDHDTRSTTLVRSGDQGCDGEPESARARQAFACGQFRFVDERRHVVGMAARIDCMEPNTQDRPSREVPQSMSSTRWSGGGTASVHHRMRNVVG